MFYDTSHLGPIGYSVQRPTPLPPTHPKLKNGRHLVKMDPLARDMAGSASTLQLQHARASGLEALSPPVLKKAADARPFPSTASAAPGEDRGINRFYPTLAETMNKMQSGALESKWERLSRWLECYSEEDAVLDAAAACEQLCGTLQETADAVPGKRNTAMSCVMLDKLLFILSKLQPKLLPAIGQTRNGLLHSIFPSFADEPDDQVRESAPTDPGALEATLEKYLGETYFDRVLNAESTAAKVQVDDAHLQEMKYWKQAYMGKALMAWRSVVAQKKSRHEEIHRLREELRIAQDDANGLRAVIAGLQKEVADTGCELNRTAKLLSESPRSKGEDANSPQVRKPVDPQSFEAQYKELEHVTESLLQYLDPVQDVSMKRIRDETEQLLRSGHSVPAALLHWGNRMRALSGLQFAPEEELASWDHSAHLLNVFVAVLSILSPQFFRKEEAQRAAQCPEMEYKAACVSNLLSNLQLPMPNTEEELANGSSTPAQHVIIMALLFECFCNLGNSIQECIAKAQQSESLAQSQGALRDPMHYWERLYFAVGLDKKAKGLSRTVLIHGIVSQNKNPADGALDPSSKYYSLQGSRLQGQVVSHIASEAEEQLQELRAVLAEFSVPLKQIFRRSAFHSADGDMHIADVQFWQICVAAKMCDGKVLGREAVKDIVAQSTMSEDRMVSPSSASGHQVDSWMSPAQFIEGLVRVAHLKSQQGAGASVPDVLRALLADHIVPKCLNIDFSGSGFVPLIRSPAVRNVFVKYQKYLVPIYEHFCPGNCRMDLKGFENFVVEGRLLDDAFAQTDVRALFRAVQQDDDAALTLLYHEFLDAVAAITAFKSPAPYLPLEARLEAFLTADLLFHMLHMFKWDYALKELVERARAQ